MYENITDYGRNIGISLIIANEIIISLLGVKLQSGSLIMNPLGTKKTVKLGS